LQLCIGVGHAAKDSVEPIVDLLIAVPSGNSSHWVAGILDLVQ
jgi:hypothetical protein